MLASSFTFWDVMWSMIVFFAWVLVIAWVIMLLIDNFRRTDHSGLAKAGWAVFLIFLPVVGAITYTIVRPRMEEAAWGLDGSSAAAAPAAGGQSAAWGLDGSSAAAAPAAGGQSAAAQIAHLNELRTQGAITDAEYDELKKKAIATA